MSASQNVWVCVTKATNTPSLPPIKEIIVLTSVMADVQALLALL